MDRLSAYLVSGLLLNNPTCQHNLLTYYRIEVDGDVTNIAKQTTVLKNPIVYIVIMTCYWSS